MALSAGESFSGGQVRDSKSRSVVISETTNAALSAGEFYSAGFLCDPDSRTVICQDTAHSALVAGETLTGGDVRDKVGRIACAVETLNAPVSAGSQFSDGWLNDSQGRRIIALDTLGAALGAGEQFTSGQIRDSVGRLVLATETAAGSAYDALVLTDTPISFWKLNETSGTTAVDSAGTNPGTYSGTFTLNQTGIGDGEQSVLFDGASGTVTIPDAASLKPASAVSLECWINYSVTPTGTPAFASKSNSTLGYILYGSGINVDWQLNASPLGSVATMAISTWYHIVGTWDGTNSRLYFNGALNSGPSALSMTNSVVAFTIASQNSTIFFHGRIAKVAVYNYALSAGQVAAHFAAG